MIRKFNSIICCFFAPHSQDNPFSLLRGPIPTSGLPRSGKKVWKMKFFLGQGKVREFWYESGKFRKKNAKSQGKVREFQISLEMVWLWQSSEK